MLVNRSAIVGILLFLGCSLAYGADKPPEKEKIYLVPEHVIIQFSIQEEQMKYERDAAINMARKLMKKYKILSVCIHEKVRTKRPVLSCFTVCDKSGTHCHPEAEET